MVHRSAFIRSFAVIGATASIVYLANAQAAPPVQGFYDLELYVSEFPFPLEPLPEPATLLVCEASPCQFLRLRARVEDSSHLPAQGGAVVFEHCSLKGNPPGSDAAPSAACESGLGMWTGRGFLDIVDGFSDITEPSIIGGASRVPRTVGFRFSYIGQGTPILKYSSEPKDVTWISVP